MVNTVHIILMNFVRFMNHFKNTVKPLNSGHLRVLKSLSVIKRCPLLGGSLQRLSRLGLNILSAIQGMPAIWDVRYWEVSLYIVHVL